MIWRKSQWGNEVHYWSPTYHNECMQCDANGKIIKRPIRVISYKWHMKHLEFQMNIGFRDTEIAARWLVIVSWENATRPKNNLKLADGHQIEHYLMVIKEMVNPAQGWSDVARLLISDQIIRQMATMFCRRPCNPDSQKRCSKMGTDYWRQM